MSRSIQPRTPRSARSICSLTADSLLHTRLSSTRVLILQQTRPRTQSSLAGAGTQSRALETRLSGDPPRLDGLFELVVVALVLVGVGFSEAGDGLVEAVGLAKVVGDRDPVAGAGMGACERPSAHLPVGSRSGRLRGFECERAFPVLEVTHVEVALLPVEARGCVLPAKEDVARRLHQTLAGDDALTAVCVFALAEELLKHRTLRLLHLEEERVSVVNPK